MKTMRVLGQVFQGLGFATLCLLSAGLILFSFPRFFGLMMVEPRAIVDHGAGWLDLGAGMFLGLIALWVRKTMHSQKRN